jgi:hypothetical protein
LGRRGKDGKTLESFKVKEGGYIGFFNPETGVHETYAIIGDGTAAKRREAKLRLEKARRGGRHKEGFPLRERRAYGASPRPVEQRL